MSYQDPCQNAIDCGETAEVGASSSESWKIDHNFSTIINSTDIVPSYLNMSRSFHAEYGYFRSIQRRRYIKDDRYLGELFPCDGSGNSGGYASVREDCTSVQHILYYIDRLNEVYVYKKITQRLNFSAHSSSLASFQCSQTRGTKLNMIKISNNVKTECTEEFFMRARGLSSGNDILLAAVNYQYNPFEGAAIKSNTYGINGSIDCSPVQPNDRDVALILMFPNPSKKCILHCLPENKDPLFYGFYDLSAVENSEIGSNELSALGKLDGGNFYFYPHWIRAMYGGDAGTGNPIYAHARDFQTQLSLSAANKGGKYDGPLKMDYSIGAPLSYNLPFGSVGIGSKEQFAYSMLLEFSPRSDIRMATVDDASMGDLYELVFVKNKIPPKGKANVYYPISPI